MFGSIAGDVIGSIYEVHNIKTTTFPLFKPECTFTDDTVCIVGIAKAVLFKQRNFIKKFFPIQTQNIYQECLLNICIKYPNRGYGFNFEKWIYKKTHKPYNSYGNGSAMRVSPIGFAFNKLDVVLQEAKLSAEITHNHSKGIEGAQAVAASIYLAYNGESKKYIKQYVEKHFSYQLNFTVDGIRNTYRYDISCQGSVPQAIVAFLESENYEDAIRKAISIGGDSDTIACITGGLAQAFYKKIPQTIISRVNEYLDVYLKKIIKEFNKCYKIAY